jgi:hypothetical protein
MWDLLLAELDVFRSDREKAQDSGVHPPMSKITSLCRRNEIRLPDTTSRTS